ncbi:BON domain-containing protein [Solimonas soli]|uniref:BON domain-containing protein n=1 Tax=Solimonas soli TaxID=413479 RepID=UPI0004807882|nr:BON domain-containing protein [Solimonas soli]
MLDQDLQRRVMAALTMTSGVDVAHIGVAVRKGVVTLSGHVRAAAEKAAAERAVRGVSGVRAIAEHLQVRPDEATRTADDEIADRAVRFLNWDLRLPAGAVRVTVERGVVALQGTVDTEYERRRAGQDIRRLHGVRDVVNGIRLREDAFGTAPDAPQIRSYAGGDGTVVLEGRVRTAREKEDLEAALMSAPGVLRVDNRIVVEAA